jgi:DNA polymerase III gamma/tau subunit
VSGLRYHGFGEQPNKAFIIDEAHALSKAAWQSLLKPIEEPPPHVYFFILTTESGKVPETIVTRCANYQLKSVKHDDLMDLLEFVSKAEGLKTSAPILSQVARACDGSPRKALVMLGMVQDCDDEDEARAILESPLDNAELIDLCRMLIRGDLTWPKLTQTLKALPEMPAESARIVIVNYLSSCAMGARSDKEAIRFCDLIYEFSKPFPTSDKLAPLLLAFSNIIFK